MNGNLPAVAKAMILASLPLCALLAACGGSSSLFDGVSEGTLAASGIVIVDSNPKTEAIVSREDAIYAAGASSDELVATRLVVARFDKNGDPAERLTWAVEMDPEHPFRCGGCTQTATCFFDSSADTAIMFIDAMSGEFLNCYAHTNARRSNYMNGELAAVAKAMILASPPLCALIVQSTTLVIPTAAKRSGGI